MRKFILLIITLLFTILAPAQHAIQFSNNRETKPTKIISENNDDLTLSFHYKGINKIDIQSTKGTFTQLLIEDTYRTGKIGEPQLPSSKKLIEIPFGADASVEIISYDEETYSLEDFGIGNQILPTQPSYEKNMDPSVQEFILHEKAYSKDAFIDFEIAKIRKVGVMRGTTLAQLTVNPITYNPIKNTIKVYNNIVLKVVFKNGDSTKTNSFKNKTSSSYFDAISGSIVNSSTEYIDNPDHTKYPVKYLIVTDPDLESGLDDFVAWKTKKGFEVIVVNTDEIGSTSSEIKAWIHAQYNAGTESDPAPTFFLLVGDTDQIPASQIGDDSGKSTDLYYACADGDDDIIPDMYYGRFSATDSTELKNMVDKVLYYEKYEFADDSYLNNVTLIAGADATWNPAVGQPTINYGTENYFNAANGFTTVNTYLDEYTNCYANDNFKVSLINYTAHGSETSWYSPLLTKSAVNSMSNTNQYPLAVANCCLTADFGYSECIGETWMRKADGGAVAYIGSSPYSYWYEDFYWSVGAHTYVSGSSPTVEESTLGVYDAPSSSDYLCVDALVFVGNLAVTEAHDQNYSSSISSKYYWEAYNCLSDPSLCIYLTQGNTNTVNHSSTFLIGATEFEVSAEAGSYVAITKDGVIHGTALVPESGVALVAVDPISTGGVVDIVVTKAQYKPYIAEIPTASVTGSYFTVNEFAIIDESGNSEVEFGENFHINLTIENVGSDLAEEVSVSITSSDNYIESIANNSNIAFPNIDAGSLQTVTGQFNILIKDSIPDQHVIVFNVDISDNSAENGNYSSTQTVVLNAPILNVAETYTIDDSENNDNGILEAGETAKLMVNISNIGHAQVSSTAQLSLTTNNPYLSIIEDTDNLGAITPNEFISAEFSIQADPSTPLGTPVNFTINAVGSEMPFYMADAEFELIVGETPTIEIGDGIEEPIAYPFNNYYTNNKTQLLYLNSEIGTDSIVISELSFDISYATPLAEYRDLSNFAIRMSLVEIDELSNYLDMSSTTIVYETDSYDLSGDTGWESLTLNYPFLYDGSSNILIEIIWGSNSDYCDLADRTKTYSSTTTNNTVAYGYSDYSTPPAFGGVSNIRPNIKLSVGEAHYLIFSIEDEYENVISGANVIIGDREVLSDEYGLAKFIYSTQQYGLNYSIDALGYYEATGTVDLDSDSVTVHTALVEKPKHTINFYVSNSDTPLSNAWVTFNNDTKESNAAGEVTFENVIEGDGYAYSVTKANYLTAYDTVNVNTSKTIQVVLNDNISIPSIVNVENLKDGKATITWLAASPTAFEDSFENYNDWDRSFGEYTIYDVDGLGVYGSDDYEYPDQNGATGFRIMNYTATSPEWGDLAGNTGSKIAASFCANGGTNNDWLITPQITISSDYEFSFYAKSITSQYGLERFNVYISTTGTETSDFTKISSGEYIEAPTSWTKMTYDLASYQGENIYLAIQCISDDAFVFMVDDIYVGLDETKVSAKLFNGYSVYLDDLENAIATNIETLEYTYTGLENGETYNAGIKGIHSSGDSELNTLQFTYNQIYTIEFVISFGGLNIEGAEIQFQGQTIYTDTEGSASFDVASGNHFDYLIYAEGYYDANGKISVTSDVVEPIILELIPDVLFTVKDNNNLALENVAISFNTTTILTDSDGNANFVDIESNNYITYSANLENYLSITDSIFMTNEDTTVNLIMNELVNINVSVKDADGIAILGAKVSINELEQYTNNTGLTTFTNLTLGTYAFSVEKDDYYLYEDSILISDSNINETVILNLMKFDVKFDITSNEAPIENALVLFNGETKATNEQGIVEFSNTPIGKYYAYSINKNGYLLEEGSIDVLSDISKPLELTLISYEVLFRVNDRNGAVEGANIDFDNRALLTDADGEIKFENVLPNDSLPYSVSNDGMHNKHIGYSPVNEDKTIDINLFMVSTKDKPAPIAHVYPNPSNGIIHIDLKGKSKLFSIQVSDESGRIIYTQTNVKQLNSIDLSEQAKGFYFIKIQTDTGIVTEKIIVE